MAMEYEDLVLEVMEEEVEKLEDLDEVEVLDEVEEVEASTK